jgi:ferric-dicitrate binding protein FerR (iron transport regulator)
MCVEDPQVPQHEIGEAWVQLQQALTKRRLLVDSSGTASAMLSKNALIGWYSVAAILVSICVSAVVGWRIFTSGNRIEYVTGFGQTKAILLPDSSQVILNGNTRLSYDQKWTGQEDREVWLDGEAYFSVAKSAKEGNKRFVVHTEKLDVEVLGTQFNVSDRKNATQVVLNEGEIKVNPSHKIASSVILKPGDLLEYSSTQQTIIKKVVNPHMYSSWKFKKMAFDETSMQEIAERIEATYGYQVIFRDIALAGRKVTGTIPSDNIDVLLLTLAKVFNLDIRKEQNQIFIKSPN